MSLTKYHQKRKFEQTPEPQGVAHAKGKILRFVVQEHHASRLHWDFRLEMQGVLKSWAVPKGPSMDTSVKHLAVHVEDHPYSYRTFEGTIPEGNYGAGTVKIWDEGTYEPFEQSDDPEKTLLAGLKKGDMKFIMHGKKLKGKFVLVKFGHEEKNWLLIKEKDQQPVISAKAGIQLLDPRVKPKDKKIKKLKKSVMPHTISPMLAKVADAPFDNPAWLFEIKWDGYRAIAEIAKGKVKLYSRNQQDFTTVYPNVVESLAKIKHDVVLDGEIVAFDKRGKASFGLMQEAKSNPQIKLIYYVFDLLYLDGYDLRSLPLIDRKELLEKLLPENEHLKYSAHIDGKGKKAFAFAKKKELEGIMAKRKASPYVSTRTSDWQKIKNIQIQEAIICGFTDPQGTREAFGALILGIYENGALRYIGHTGGGFDVEKLREMKKLLEPLITDKSPFARTPKTNAAATWVKPKLVCQIKFSEWTSDGMLRQPVFLGLREDKKVGEVVKESSLRGVEDDAAISSTKGIASPSRLSRTDRNDGKSKVEVSHLDKVFWPDEGYTKGDVITYYDRIAPWILPYLKDRAESLNRHPDGIDGNSFYQKDVLHAPSWAKRVRLYSSSEKKYIHWLVCNDKDTLLLMANWGCIEINPWSSRLATKDKPDYVIIDLDPNGVDFSEVITVAKFIKKLLDKAQVDAYLKTSGKTGMHIFIPLGAKYSYEHGRQFAEIIARIVSKAFPQTTSVVRNPEKREKKMYIDFLQNRVGQTIAAPYSLRPVPGACVSTPLEWSELKAGLLPSNFTIENIFKRLEKKGDVWTGFVGHKGINMLKSLDLLQKKK